MKFFKTLPKEHSTGEQIIRGVIQKFVDSYMYTLKNILNGFFSFCLFCQINDNKYLKILLLKFRQLSALK